MSAAQKNSVGTTRLQGVMGFASLKPHLVRKLRKEYTPDKADELNIMQKVDASLQLYRCMRDEDADSVGASMQASWAEVFGDDSGEGVGGGGPNVAMAREIARLKKELSVCDADFVSSASYPHPPNLSTRPGVIGE
jgi:hypothetical protein